MEAFDEFLKQFAIKELNEDKPNGKPYWQATEKGAERGKGYRITALTGTAIMGELRKTWACRIARTYHDDKGKWWVGEKGSRKGFKTEEDAMKHRSTLITKYS